MNKRLFVLTGLTALLAACGTSPSTSPEGPGAGPGRVTPGQIIVKYRPGLSAANVKPLANTRLLSTTGEGTWGRLALVGVPRGQEETYAERYTAQGGVEYAEPNSRVERPQDVSFPLAAQGSRTGKVRAAANFPSGITDPYFVQSPVDANGNNPFDLTAAQTADGQTAYTGERYLWGLDRVRAPGAWDAGFTGQGVVVAVVDEGADLGHPDLAPNLWENPDPDSATCPGEHGYDFVDDDPDPSDSGGHGTHVSGTIVAAANGQGVVGVAPEARLMVVRGLGSLGGSVYTLTRALKYAADCGAQVVNNSWLSGTRSRAWEDVLEYGTARGVTYVFSAGNSYSGRVNPPQYPAASSTTIPGVIGVGATSNDNRPAAFSSRGNWVTVAAPGAAILSSIPRSQSPDDPYAFLQGTSMAAPHVTGIVALLYQARPDITPEGVRQALTWSANSRVTGQNSKPDSPTGGSYGYGIVDAEAAVGYARESLR